MSTDEKCVTMRFQNVAEFYIWLKALNCIMSLRPEFKRHIEIMELSSTSGQNRKWNFRNEQTYILFHLSILHFAIWNHNPVQNSQYTSPPVYII